MLPSDFFHRNVVLSFLNKSDRYSPCAAPRRSHPNSLWLLCPPWASSSTTNSLWVSRMGSELLNPKFSFRSTSRGIGGAGVRQQGLAA
jgi:hypothetical protein